MHEGSHAWITGPDKFHVLLPHRFDVDDGRDFVSLPFDMHWHLFPRGNVVVPTQHEKDQVIIVQNRIQFGPRQLDGVTLRPLSVAILLAWRNSKAFTNLSAFGPM